MIRSFESRYGVVGNAAPGGRGGGGSLLIRNEWQFADTAARDAYFPTRLSELTTDTIIFIESSDQLQRWEGANNPPSYDNTMWQDFSAAIRGRSGIDGTNGWTPVLAGITDGERRVLQVIDWAGGTGTKPTTGQYVGETGLVDDIADGKDIRGEKGADGSDGAKGDKGDKGDQGDPGTDGADGTDGVGIQSITASQSGTLVTVRVTLTNSTVQEFQFQSDGSPMPTRQYKVFTQASSTVIEQDINDEPDEGTTLPYRKILPTPLLNNMVVAWHASDNISDIHVNILTADEGIDDITTSPLGNRFVQSEVQTIGTFEVQVVNIQSDIALLQAGEKLGIYVG